MILLDELFRDLPLSESNLRAVMLSAPNRYKFFYIAKKSGGKRLISQPAKEVKWLQRIAVNKLRETIPVHPCATAYEPGSSILLNAKQHASNRFLLKIDFKDFFPSIKEDDVIYLLKNSFQAMGDEEVNLITKLLVLDGPLKEGLALAAGAPSSPFISNALMYEFDATLSDYCRINSVTYTRYADDLALSTNTPLLLKDVFEFVNDLVKKSNHPKLRINEEKTIFTSKKHNRKVTGLTLTSTNQISLGRDTKRELRAAVDKFRKNLLDAEALANLRGRLSYARSVEPSFIDRLKAHYGIEVIDNLLCK